MSAHMVEPEKSEEWIDRRVWSDALERRLPFLGLLWPERFAGELDARRRAAGQPSGLYRRERWNDAGAHIGPILLIHCGLAAEVERLVDRLAEPHAVAHVLEASTA